MNVRHACVLGLALGFVGWGTAQAQTMGPPNGWYLRLQGGWNALQDMHGKGSGSPLDFTAQHDDGYILGGAGGYKFGELSIELEVDYRDNGVDKVHFGNGGSLGAVGGTTQTGSGRISSFSEIISGVYDIPWTPAPRWQPYIGFGVGFTSIRLGGYGGNLTRISGDNDTVFALQPKIGIRYMLSDSMALGVEYRYLDGLNPKFVDRSGHQFSGNYNNHSLMLNLTWYLNPPAPPAPPPVAPAVAPAPAAAPAPAERQVFIVFFDFDKATITPAGKQIIAEAAKAFQAGHRVLLTGYTDRAGTPQYNLGLSKRRAEAARDEMVRDGVPANAINVSWKGEQDPRVPTPDGVREPQNRRVEIVLP
ncbi:MAG TPA: OmpA family protein [Stellaceae bacterium]|nr:OmpA family protein [Stellaceae bacterium]